MCPLWSAVSVVERAEFVSLDVENEVVTAMPEWERLREPRSFRWFAKFSIWLRQRLQSAPKVESAPPTKEKKQLQGALG